MRVDPVKALIKKKCTFWQNFTSVVAAGKQRPATTDPFPVMIFVHGESFSWGSGNLFDGRVLAAFGEVVVITFNFRLGVLGESRRGHERSWF